MFQTELEKIKGGFLCSVTFSENRDLYEVI